MKKCTFDDLMEKFKVDDQVLMTILNKLENNDILYHNTKTGLYHLNEDNDNTTQKHADPAKNVNNLAHSNTKDNATTKILKKTVPKGKKNM